MAYLDRDGVRISYQATGEPNGNLPVLLSHGFSASAAMWDANLPVLAATRQVITWDMRGHGGSGCPSDPRAYSREHCVADMAGLLDAHDIARAVLGGLSLGGYLSLAFALAHPGRVAALMLFDTGPGFRSDQARQQWNDRALATADRLESTGRLGLAHAARGMLTQADAHVIDSLTSIDVPVLVLVGARDLAYLDAADYMTRKIAWANRVVIEDAGHTCNTDQPAAFNRLVTAFLDRPAGCVPDPRATPS